MNKKIAAIFPGQGAQYPQMGKDFYDQFSIARQAWEEAEDLTRLNLRDIVFNQDAEVLKNTAHCQIAIYVNSCAIYRVLNREYPDLLPFAVSGLSLGEYSALTTGGYLSFQEGVSLVHARGKWMQQAAEQTSGGMVAVLGLDNQSIEDAIGELKGRFRVWIANYNSPGQIVISGALQDLPEVSNHLKLKGAKRCIPLDVAGAFHSPLMDPARVALKSFLEKTVLTVGQAQVTMNVPGTFVSDVDAIRTYLIDQITHPVRWQQQIEQLSKAGIELFIEIGPGKTLTGMNRKMGLGERTVNVERSEDLTNLLKQLEGVYASS